MRRDRSAVTRKRAPQVGLLASLAGLPIVDTLLFLYVTDEQRIPIECALGRAKDVPCAQVSQQLLSAP